MKLEFRGQDMIVALRARAQGALRRLSGKAAEKPAPPAHHDEALSYSFNDPTRVLFPSNADDGDGPRAHSLSALFMQAAHNIEDRENKLHHKAVALRNRLRDRADGEVTLAVQFVRFVIAGLWVLTAAWLYLSGIGALTGDLSALSEGLPAENAKTLARTFFPIGALGVGVALGVSALVSAMGNNSNGNVRNEAHNLGVFIAHTAEKIDQDLARLRAAMDKSEHSEDAVDDLSRTYVTALEATTYFRLTPFLTDPDESEAKSNLEKFLTPRYKPSVSASEVFLIGFFAGAVAVTILFVPKPDIALAALPDIAKYPWAANLLLFGGLTFAMAGVLMTLAKGAISHGAIEKARAEALDAIRSAYTTQKGPRLEDIVQRIQDAVDVFRARVGRGGGRRDGGDYAAPDRSEASSTGYSNADDAPAWRRRDSSAKFVDTGFQAAPESWRTDAYSKKFEAGDARESDSKRGLLGLKKPTED